MGSQLGRELFPRVDTGQFQLRVRPPQGTQFELTTRVAQKTLDVIAEEVGRDKIEITMGYAGGNPPQFTINMAYLWSRGPDDSLLRVGLREGSGVDIFDLQERLRTVLPQKVGAWFRQELLKLGVAPELAERRARDMIFAFEPGDLISQTMSLGAPAPIEVVVSGRNMADSSEFMDKLREQFDQIGALRDVQVQQSLHYPTVQVTLDRERAGLSGVTARDVGQSLIAATYSSRYTSRNFWRDDVSGNSYQVQVQVPQPKMTEATDVELVPLTTQANRQQAATDRRFTVQPDSAALDPRRGAGDAQRDARRGRPLQHEALPEPDGQHRGRRPGACDQSPGSRRWREPASRRGGSRYNCAVRSSRCGRCSRAWRSAWPWPWS